MVVSLATAARSSARSGCRWSSVPLGSLPVTTLMERLEVDPADRDHVLAELQKRYSRSLDALFRIKGVQCPGRRDELVQTVWYRIWRRCARAGGWKPGRGNDPLWSLMKKVAERLLIDQHRRGRTADSRWTTFCDDRSTFGADVAGCLTARVPQPGASSPRGPRIELVAAMSRRERARLEKAAIAEFRNLARSDRRALVLVAKGRTTREIGIRIKRSPGQVSKVLNAARREVITRALGDDGPGDAGAKASSPGF